MIIRYSHTLSDYTVWHNESVDPAQLNRRIQELNSLGYIVSLEHNQPQEESNQHVRPQV